MLGFGWVDGTRCCSVNTLQSEKLVAVENGADQKAMTVVKTN